jgi:hypothetical protein
MLALAGVITAISTAGLGLGGACTGASSKFHPHKASSESSRKSHQINAFRAKKVHDDTELHRLYRCSVKELLKI